MAGPLRPYGIIRVGLQLILCAAPLAVAQNLPACGQTCIANEIALASSLGCPSGDNTCLCKNSAFGYGIRDCAEQSCPTTADVDATINYANTYCGPILGGSSLIASSTTSSSGATSSSKPTTTTASTKPSTRSSAPSNPTLSSAVNPGITTYTTYVAPVTITFTSTGSPITATYETTSFITNLGQYMSLESSQPGTVATTLSSTATPSPSSTPASSAAGSSSFSFSFSSSSSSASAAAATASANTANGGGGGLSTSAKVGIGVGVGVVGTAMIIGLIFVFLIVRRLKRRPSHELEGDSSFKGEEQSALGNGGAHSYNYKTGYDPAVDLGRGEGAGAGGAGVGGAYSYNYSSGYDRGDHQQESTGQNNGGGAAGKQNGETSRGEQRQGNTAAPSQEEPHPEGPPRSNRAQDQGFKLDLDLGEKW